MKKYKKNNEFRLWHLFSILIISGIMFAGITIFGSWAYAYVESLRVSPVTNGYSTTTDVDEQAILLATRQKLSEANVFIQVNYASGYEIGSGTIIHQDTSFYYAVTNEHILDGNNEVIDSQEVTTYDNISSDFEMLAIDQEKDLALIKFSKENRSYIQPINTIDEAINIDDIVIAIGNPYGNVGSITYGSIIQLTTLRELEISRLVIEHNAALNDGSSGGALVDIYGNLVGINGWELNGLFYAIPITVINTFLKNNI
ncbi:MAG: trypsin-like peptidase domain-containing protein [Gammaproteobacteria bacterium]